MMELCINYIIANTDDPILIERLEKYRDEKKKPLEYYNIAINKVREKILKIIPDDFKALSVDYETHCFQLMFSTDKPNRILPRGMAITIPKIYNSPGRSITYEVAILDSTRNVIFDENIGYSSTNQFHSFESICDELIRLVYLPIE